MANSLDSINEIFVFMERNANIGDTTYYVSYFVMSKADATETIDTEIKEKRFNH